MAPKRKRASTLPSTTADAPQANSRDASGEDTAYPVLDDVLEHKESPPKRTRSTRSTAAAASSNGAGTVDEAGENNEADNMRMAPVPKAGLVDPMGGYKTNKPPKDRMVRVYADGVFDLFHLGHMRQLEQAKSAFPNTYLIVGVTGDGETHKRKGLTVLSAKERAESVRHCKWVDEVVEDCPWVINVPFLEKHRIDYVAHDDIPYGASEGDDIYKPIKERGQFLVTQRTEGVSTTGIITKIVRDYEQYIARQLKRGTSRQELNISWLKKNQLDIKRHVDELRDTIRTNWTTTGQELGKELRQFWQPSRQSSPAPSTRNSINNGTAGRGTPSRASMAKSPIPNALEQLSHLEVPTPSGNNGGTATPTGTGRSRNSDFAAGYAMGLIGGVKGWMQGSRRRNLSDSRNASPPSASDEDSGDLDAGEAYDEGEARGRKKVRMSLAAEDSDEVQASRQLEDEAMEGVEKEEKEGLGRGRGKRV